MFLDDEIEYIRLKRSDSVMGWVAISFVAALVFMFAGLMNSASATGSTTSRAPALHILSSPQAAPSSALISDRHSAATGTPAATAKSATSIVELKFAW